MNFSSFLSYIQLKGINTTSEVLYQSQHSSEHTDKDEFSFYSMLKISIFGDSLIAEVVYTYERSGERYSYRMINCDIFFKKMFSIERDSLFLKNVTLHKLIDTFEQES